MVGSSLPGKRSSITTTLALPVGSIAPVLIDDVEQLVAPLPAPEILDEQLAERLKPADEVAGHVRRDHDLRHLPQRTILGKRLLREHIEGGPRDPSLPKRLYQRGLVDYGPSSDVYEPSAGLHPLELGSAEHAARLIRERRRDDGVVSFWERLIELIGSIPTIPLWAALAAALPGNISVVRRYFFITLILSLVAWTGLARQVRGKVLSYRSADYTSAARAAGGSHLRVIMTHMIPNASSHIIVVAALAVPATILAETTLSFLGFGMQAPAVSWGTLLQDAQNIAVVTRYPWLLLPGLAVVIALICYQFLGDGLRDAADPYS